jgi:small-conductance mechanosensitive channel
MNTERLLGSMLNDIWQDFRAPGAALQLAVLAACLGLAWWRAGAGLRRAEGIVTNKAAQQALKRLMFPLIALVLVAIARPIAAGSMPTNFLRLATTLLLAYTLIQAVVFAVSTLTNTPALRAFERLIVVSVWIGAVLYITGYWVDVVEVLESVKLPFGKTKLDLWTLLSAAFWVVVTLLVALWVGGLIETKLLAQNSVDASVRAVVGRILRAVLLIVGVLVGLSLVGLDLTALSVFGGALGVGLGLGLQRIASNYVSGFIVLLERMVRIGDIVKVDQFQGQVHEIRTRFTVLRGLDGIDHIVPNEMLTSLAVQNFSRAGALRLRASVQIPYDSDHEQAALLATQAALSTPRVLQQPGPLVMLKQFAPDGIDLEVGFSIADPALGQGNVVSEVQKRILMAFRDAGLHVPFPQREIRIVDERLAAPLSGSAAGPAASVPQNPLPG